MSKPRKSCGGFTLIELVLVIALIASMTWVYVINVTCMYDTVTHAELDKLYTICYYLQRYAQVTNQIQILSFDAEHGRYMFQGITEKLPAEVQFGGVQGMQGSPGAPHKPEQRAITFVEQRILFYPTGVQQAGTVYLRGRSGSRVYALSSPVSQVSYLRKYRYDGNWKLID